MASQPLPALDENACEWPVPAGELPPTVAATTADPYPQFPAELKELRRWVTWKYEERDGKPTKVLYTPGINRRAKSTDATTWVDYRTAIEARGNYAGVGCVIAAPYTAVDLDKCRNPETRQTEPWALAIIDELNSYTELSPSGGGYHIWVIGTLPPDGRRKGRIEMYSGGRYFTVTGEHVAGTPLTIETRDLSSLHERMVAEKLESTSTSTSTSSSTRGLVVTNDGGEKLQALMAGSWQGRYTSQSEADSALCVLLAYKFRSDAEKIDAEFRRSGLYREKWERPDYRKRTIEHAIALVSTAPHRPPDTTATTVEFRFTDCGNAERLVAAEPLIRYCGLLGTWFTWNLNRWVADDSGEIYRRAKDTVRKMLAQACTIADDAKRGALLKHQIASEAEARINSMISLARRESGVPVRAADLDANLELLNCENGTLDLRRDVPFAERLHESHRPEDLVTKLAPVQYDPAAKCPMWDKFLLTVTGGNMELVKYLQRCVGYSLTGLTSERCFFLLWGVGKNGKSTFLNVIRRLLGDYARSSDFDTFMASKSQAGQARPDLVHIMGARFVTASESEQEKRLAEAQIKALTGGDMLSLRQVYQKNFDCMPQFKLWLGTNHRPQIRGVDPAIWDRVRLIPFIVRIEPTQQVRDLDRVMFEQEASGILNWTLQGLLEYHRLGLADPQAVSDATAEYREGQDVLQHFFDEHCIIASDCKGAGRSLYVRYKGWADAAGEVYIMTERQFGQALQDRGFQRKRVTQGMVWTGIALRD